MGSAKCSYVDEHVLSRASAKVSRLVSGMLRSQARSTADIHGQSVLWAGRRAGTGDELSINCGFPVLARPPQHDRGHRTIGYWSEPVSAQFRTESQADQRGYWRSRQRDARSNFARRSQERKSRISGAAHGSAHPRGGVDRVQSLVTSSPHRSSRTADLMQRIWKHSLRCASSRDCVATTSAPSP